MMKRLGDYIRPVDVRNRDLKVTRLVGLTIDKAFIPSVANTIGTDLSNYKVNFGKPVCMQFDAGQSRWKNAYCDVQRRAVHYVSGIPDV